eukprot:1503251-Amphidinium_carterae.1
MLAIVYLSQASSGCDTWGVSRAFVALPSTCAQRRQVDPRLWKNTFVGTVRLGESSNCLL